MTTGNTCWVEMTNTANMKSKHVIYRRRGWAVKTAGTLRAEKVFKGKDDAVEFARDAARKMHGAMYVHNEDGTVQYKRSYSLD